MPYIIKISAAKMPSSVRAPYKRIAVLEVEDGVTKIAMISPRARGVRRVVQVWDRVPAQSSRGANTDYGRAMAEATALRDTLTAVGGV